jgi:hypothetical protein
MPKSMKELVYNSNFGPLIVSNDSIDEATLPNNTYNPN